MCLVAIYHRIVPQAGVLLAANREELYARPTLSPRIVPVSPHLAEGAPQMHVLCGVDAVADGTWLGVNQFGVVVAVTNRASRGRESLASIIPPNGMSLTPKTPDPLAFATGCASATQPRSRGLLCREALAVHSAREAAEHVRAALASGQYAGANFICLDAHDAAVVHGGDRIEVIHLTPGSYFIASGDLDDPHDLRLRRARELFGLHPIRTAGEFIDAARHVCADAPAAECTADPANNIVIRRADRGTVSSTILAMPDPPLLPVYLYAPGAPDVTAYDDNSHLLRRLLTL